MRVVGQTSKRHERWPGRVGGGRRRREGGDPGSRTTTILPKGPSVKSFGRCHRGGFAGCLAVSPPSSCCPPIPQLSRKGEWGRAYCSRSRTPRMRHVCACACAVAVAVAVRSWALRYVTHVRCGAVRCGLERVLRVAPSPHTGSAAAGHFENQLPPPPFPCLPAGRSTRRRCRGPARGAKGRAAALGFK
ncbi:uncharacterized protein LY79DRAFT_205842 [Colletotrichum navitas]|uniref:Uncharacterized protein n=1 Tax=Colletotrichum navitas TaxID=681940 RepID=A0AAD8QAF5_9PEZI|nr:uncharacterized protein LY79DRAFT_205842 [Colletotrichum navitas]KAK1599033.1 hypothetical protein LY79DRAFT_205842 [Colletotrichum navitas]